MSNYPNLFSSYNLAGIKMRSRTIQSGMVSNLCEENGLMTDREIQYHVLRAKNGIGLQLVGAAYITKQSHAYKYQEAIDRDECIPGLTRLTRAVHEAGGNIGIQIWHAGASADPRYSGMEIVSCSPNDTPFGKAHELTADEIKVIVSQYADGAERAKKSGFDLIEIHGTAGYLIDQFFSPATNHRTDEYGGSLENRMRFALEVTHAVRDRVGQDFPLSFRITSTEFRGKDGNQIEDAIALASRLVDECGVQLINVICSGMKGMGRSYDEEGFLAPFAAKIKENLNGKAAVSVANLIKRPEVAEKILSSGQTDLVTMGRATICDPELLTKAKEGRDEDIRKCTSCCYCVATMREGNRTACMQNPLMGHEFEYSTTEKSKTAKRVIVAGGGPAGMQAAIVAAHRGHNVTLCEASNVLGGKANIADKPPFKDEIEYVITNLEHELAREKVDIRLNCKVTKDMVLAEKADAVIVACGAVPSLPPVPGMDQKNVVFAQDVILGNSKAEGKVVIVGGGSVGIETADLLLEKGCDVTIVEMLPRVLSDLFIVQAYPYMVRVLPRVEILTEAKVTAVEGNKVFTDKKTIEGVDMVVLAAGNKSVNALVAELSGIGVEVKAVGDSVRAGNFFAATHTAYKAAYEL